MKLSPFCNKCGRDAGALEHIKKEEWKAAEPFFGKLDSHKFEPALSLNDLLDYIKQEKKQVTLNKGKTELEENYFAGKFSVLNDFQNKLEELIK